MRFFVAALLLCLAFVSPIFAQPGVQTFPSDAPLRSQFRSGFERFGMPAVAIGPAIYVVDGYSRRGLSGAIERIDTETNTVSTLPTTLLPRGFCSAEAVGNAIYVFGGVSRGFVFSDKVERFDTQSGKVTFASPMPAPLRNIASVAVGGKIYVIGGSDAAEERHNFLWIYDPQLDQWTPGAPLKTARECAVVAANGTIYAIGGFDGKTALTSCEAYDIHSNTWRDLPDLPIKTSAHHLARVGDAIFAFGDYAELARVQKFDLTTGTWTRLDKTGYDPRRHVAVCSVKDNIYVIGGNIAPSGSFLDEIQVFDAAKLN